MPRAKYHWTPEQDTRLRLIYQTSCGRERMIPKLKKMAEELAWPRHTLRMRAQRLGLTKNVAKPWTDKEIRYIEDHAGKMSIRAMARTLGRTYMSIASKVNRGFFRTQDQMILGELVQIFAVTWARAKQWEAAGFLVPSAGDWYTLEDVHRFMLAHPEVYDPRTIDIEFLRNFIAATALRVKQLEDVPRGT